MRNSTLTFSFTPYIKYPNCVQPLTYTAKLSNGSALPTFISFQASKLMFNVYTTKNSMADVYSLWVKAVANDQTAVTD